MRRMRSIAEILSVYKSKDPDTRLTKYCLRVLALSKKVHGVQVNNRKWLLDLDNVMSYFDNSNIEMQASTPRLRYFEKSYHLLKVDLPGDTTTWNELYSIINSGDIFVLKHGKRWLLNYDELLKLVISNNEKKAAALENSDSDTTNDSDNLSQ